MQPAVIVLWQEVLHSNGTEGCGDNVGLQWHSMARHGTEWHRVLGHGLRKCTYAAKGMSCVP